MRPCDVAREDLPRTAALLGSDDRRELPPADVADEPARRPVEPADDTRAMGSCRSTTLQIPSAEAGAGHRSVDPLLAPPWLGDFAEALGRVP